METTAVALVSLSLLVLLATWVAYPVWLGVRARSLPESAYRAPHVRWPTVAIVVVVRNAEPRLRSLVETLLGLAYPAELRRILVVSNASTDFTDAIARSYADRGVDLLRVLHPDIAAADALNLARRWTDAEVVVLVHPDGRPRPSALAAIAAPFADPTVGVAYGREVESEPEERGARTAGTLYRRFERRLRFLESRVFGTASSRRALYAVRRGVYAVPVPHPQSPDFAPMLTAVERGFRAVYVDDAECEMVPHQPQRRTYAQTVGTVARDVATLLGRPRLLDPRRYGSFAWILLGHKLGRWVSPWALAAGLVGLLLLAPEEAWARVACALVAALAVLGGVGSVLPARTAVARLAAYPIGLAANAVAIAHAGVMALTWKPALAFAPVHPEGREAGR